MTSPQDETMEGTPALDVQNQGDDDFGRVRDRRDFSFVDIPNRQRLLPTPYREYTFTNRSGWRYHPRAPAMDRLGSVRSLQGKPIDDNPLPLGWEDTAADFDLVEASKRQKMTGNGDQFGADISLVDHTSASIQDCDATLITVSTAGSSTTPLSHVGADTLTTATASGINSEFNSLALTTSSPPLSQVSPTMSTVRLNENPLSTESSTNIAASSTNASKQKSTSSTAVTDLKPKAILYQFYGKKPRRVQLNNNEQYVTWDNGKITHEQLFTSLFVCPLTDEVFLAGPWDDAGDNPDSHRLIDGIYWYPRKVMAEHAVAARVMDCLSFRDGQNLKRLGLAEPYHPSQRPNIPLNSVPKKIVEQAPQLLQQPIASVTGSSVSAQKPDASAPHQMETVGQSDAQSVATSSTTSVRTDNAVRTPRPRQMGSTQQFQQPKRGSHSHPLQNDYQPRQPIHVEEGNRYLQQRMQPSAQPVHHVSYPQRPIYDYNQHQMMPPPPPQILHPVTSSSYPPPLQQPCQHPSSHCPPLPLPRPPPPPPPPGRGYPPQNNPHSKGNRPPFS